ncbi:helix-turn-helix domain-containing protein [Neorhizobium petrolearium]|uniref:helix-turn-helix domain-containing protein n=1 Tax=Neorhizobium petrolearium TaxID=515361 RepID=UPI003F800757
MTITCRLISECVSQAYGMPLTDIYAMRKTRDLLTPRRMAWRLARDLTTKSYPEIGRHMGGRDHSTVMYGICRLEEAMAEDPDLVTAYSDIRGAVLVMDEATNRADRLRRLFVDHDPVAAAERYLDAPRETAPPVEEVRALAMGVIHYATELTAAQEENARLQSELALIEPKGMQRDRLAAAETVAHAFQHLQVRKSTPAEPEARQIFEDALKTLSPLFQKDMNA